MKIKRLYSDAKIPTKAHEGDLGYDLYSLNHVNIFSHTTRIIRTGIAIEFPKHFGGIIKDKSSIATNLNLFTVAGVIDSGYIGEILVVMYNAGMGKQTIAAGSKIAQLLLVPVVSVASIEIVDELQSWDYRGAGGFGSTGE